jgi:uncharacterized protein (TIGR02598 family)
MNNPSFNTKRLRSRGFSLVEVTFALAVISFAGTVLLGLLAESVSTFHQAMGNTAEADIVQSISNDLRMDNFSELTGYVTSPPVYYYDREGTLLPSQSGYFYEASVTISQVSNQNSPTTLDPSGNTAVAAYGIAVTITNLGDQTAYTLQHPHVYSLIIANNGL